MAKLLMPASGEMALSQEESGKPLLPGGHVSLSHSDNQIAAAYGASEGIVEIGIDVEDVQRESIADQLGELVLHPNERQAVSSKAISMLQIWVCKEALIKAGFMDIDSMNRVDLTKFAKSNESNIEVLRAKGKTPVFYPEQLLPNGYRLLHWADVHSVGALAIQVRS